MPGFEVFFNSIAASSHHAACRIWRNSETPFRKRTRKFEVVTRGRAICRDQQINIIRWPVCHPTDSATGFHFSRSRHRHVGKLLLRGKRDLFLQCKYGYPVTDGAVAVGNVLCEASCVTPAIVRSFAMTDAADDAKSLIHDSSHRTASTPYLFLPLHQRTSCIMLQFVDGHTSSQLDRRRARRAIPMN
jgi:hypothetical protein